MSEQDEKVNGKSHENDGVQDGSSSSSFCTNDYGDMVEVPSKKSRTEE